MRISTDENGYVTGFALVGDVEKGEDYAGDIPESFFENSQYFMLQDGVLVYDENKKEESQKKTTVLEQIFELKKLLQETDYIACKIAEGVASITEYEKEIELRKQWRKGINELEAQL